MAAAAASKQPYHPATQQPYPAVTASLPSAPAPIERRLHHLPAPPPPPPPEQDPEEAFRVEMLQQIYSAGAVTANSMQEMPGNALNARPTRRYVAPSHAAVAEATRVSPGAYPNV